jgi:hypothetical protein
LDALAIALAAIVKTVGIDEDEAVAEWKELQLMDELNQFIGDIIDPKWTNSTLRFP